ncbi:MAG: YfhO family protein, partial [Lachnospiraceae bacterium]|nr:YfhO family protein [Lachnospiraceae bacterium]
MTESRIKEPLIPAFITLMVFMGVLLIKGIFPFGNLRIDYYDMGQTNAPLYYHIWDFLHGRGGLFYSWYIDGGQNLSMGSSIQWNISVFNLFFLLVRRNAVMKSLSLFMGLHLFFMAFNMDLFLKRAVNTSRFYRILFSTAYGLTGFTLTHYTIPTYLDTAALMPLYLITLRDMLVSERYGAASSADIPGDGVPALKGWKRVQVYIKPITVYALMTGYMTALGYYMAFMNLIFILLISGTWVFTLCGADAADKGERSRIRGRAALRLGLGTFCGIGLSAFILLPAAMQMMRSSRFNSNLSGGLFDTLHEILWAIGADMYYIKWWLLSGSLAAIVILLTGLFRYRRERRQAAFFFLFCMYPCALIPFESINLLWHMGTYYHYPIRCGYLIPIVLLTAAAFYAGRYEEEINTGRDHVNRIVIASAASAAAGAGLILYYIRHDVWQIEELFRAWTVFALVLTILYFLIWCVIKKPVYIAPVLLMELTVTAFAGYGQPHFTDRFSSDPEQSGEYVVMSQKLADGLDIRESRTERIKNPDTTLNTNYGFIMRRATVGGWANTVPGEQMDSAIALGYGAHFMRILDCGGTLLSDAALHVTETLTAEPKLYNGEAWEACGESGGYRLFRNKYTLPFVMRVKKTGAAALEGDALSGMEADEATNMLYRALAKDTGLDEGDIIRDVTEEIRKGSYYVNRKKALYLREGAFDRLTVNGETIPVPDIGDPHGVSYPAWFNSALLYIGIYEDQVLEVKGADDPDTRFYELDMEKLEGLCGY